MRGSYEAHVCTLLWTPVQAQSWDTTQIHFRSQETWRDQVEGVQARTVVVDELCEGWNVLLCKQADAEAEAAGACGGNAGTICRVLCQDRHNDAIWAA